MVAIACLFFILLAWFVEMPLWLSITITTVCGIVFVCKFIKLGMDISNK